MLKLQPSKNHSKHFIFPEFRSRIDLFNGLRRFVYPTYYRALATGGVSEVHFHGCLWWQKYYWYTGSKAWSSISGKYLFLYIYEYSIYSFNFWLKLIMFLQILQLCTVTLSLFETLVGLNCEDVMLWLVFRHLIPMDHLVPCQRPSIKQPDLHGRASERYVSTSIEIQNTTFK